MTETEEIKATETETDDDYDNPWKEMLSQYFQDFMFFFFPWAAEDIDWERGYEFFDKELQQVVRDAELGKRYADKLVRVFRKDQTEAWVLIHVEIQGQKDSDFAKRMYVYHYRIFDRYHKPVASMAILADEHTNWKPSQYQEELWKCDVVMRFPVIKLTDYKKKNKWNELEQSTNPFAIAVMAHIKTMESRHNADVRKVWKITLTRRLYELGYDRKDILQLFTFIDWLMRLPHDLENSFWKEFTQFEEEKRMPYITTVERRGIEKGIEIGIHQGIQKGIIDILKLRFKRIPKAIPKTIQDITDSAKLNRLLKKAVQVDSLDMFVKEID